MKLDLKISGFTRVQMERSQAAINRALLRLSSGKRVNSAADDVASFSAGTTLEARLRGIRQAVQNLNQAQGLFEVADSGMQSQLDLIQRMREIAVQGANGTLSTADRTNLNKELNQLIEEYQRIATQTEFNGKHLLDGSLGTTTLQIGEFKDSTMQFSIDNVQSNQVFQKTVGKGTFNTATTTNIGTLGFKTIIADVNNDGNMDTINSALHLGVTLGRGDGTFGAPITRSFAGTYAIDLQVADTNGDGILDVVTLETPGLIAVYRGNGDGTFQAAVTSTISAVGGITIADISVGDINGDGYADIAYGATNPVYGNIIYRYGQANGTFSAEQTVAIGVSIADISIIDINNDGKNDIVALESGGGISTFLGNGYGQLGARKTSAVSTLGGAEMEIADLNNDGKLDIFATDNVGYFNSILGNGDGTFQSRWTIGSAPALIPQGASLADVTGDGILDALVSYTGGGGTPGIYMYTGVGDGTFATPTRLTALMAELAVGDLNNDGVSDLVAVDGASTTLQILLTQTKSVSALPNMNVNSTASSAAMLKVLDSAIASISASRAEVSALHNRLDSQLSSNLLLSETLDEARSKMLDADIAEETAELVRHQILQQAQIAVAAQANLQLQTVLGLFRF